MDRTNAAHKPQPNRAASRGTAAFLKWTVIAIALSALLALALAGADNALANGGPHGGYSVLTDTCATCHRSHTAAASTLRSDTLQGNAFCLSCHDGATATAVATHANSDFTDRVEANFQLQCIQCHDPHGSKTNLRSIRDNLGLQTGLTSGPVVFTARTGLNSFDDGVSANASRLCVSCHADPNNPGYPMAGHSGGANHAGGAFDFSGQDCITCHPHDLDNDHTTADGFMPKGGCVVCHGLLSSDCFSSH
jgi:predicted CXXCH cytochrome family protein